MKNYRQVHIIAEDKGFTYGPIPNTPEFHDEKEALDYWVYNQNKIKEANFYNNPIVIIRKEVHNVLVKQF